MRYGNSLDLSDEGDRFLFALNSYVFMPVLIASDLHLGHPCLVFLFTPTTTYLNYICSFDLLSTFKHIAVPILVLTSTCPHLWLCIFLCYFPLVFNVLSYLDCKSFSFRLHILLIPLLGHLFRYITWLPRPVFTTHNPYS